MLALSSNPIIRTRALKYIQAIKANMLPIEPYKVLYCPKLFTKYENPIEVNSISNVATIDPSEINVNFVRLAGAQ
jgi:hypothetical protein